MNLLLARIRKLRQPPRLVVAATELTTTDPQASPVVNHEDDLQHADASRAGAYEELLLLEKHIKQAPCPRCMTKHAITARGLLNEAAGLKGGRPQDATVLARRVEDARRLLPTDPSAALTQFQAVRLVLGEKLGYHRGWDGVTHATGATAPPLPKAA